MNDWVLESEVEFLGTISDMGWSAESGDWIASPAGLFHNRNGRWQLIQKQVPFWHLNTVTVEEKTILAAGLPKGILRSAVGGNRWEMAWVEQTDRPITCLVASPNLQRDGVWLAGTQGDGVLRSTDNGRHWELVNWGLRDFTVLDLVTAPVWGEREFVYAVTADGVYQSPNGGRAWRFIGDSFDFTDPIQACAVSADFANDQTVWLGSENGALYVSNDKGRNWQTAVSANSQFKTITALAINNEGALMIGAGNQGLFVWHQATQEFELVDQPELTDDQLILKLNIDSEKGFAGILNGGLWQTEDGGQSWTAVSQLNAGRFMWVEGSNGSLVTGGPNVGLWHGDDSVLDLQNEPLLAVAVTENGRYLSRPSGISRNDKVIWQSRSPAIQLATTGLNSCMALTQSGALYHFVGEAVQMLDKPSGYPVAAVGNESLFVCATYHPKRREVVIYIADRSTDSLSWQAISDFPSTDGRVQLAISDDAVVYAGFGRTVRQISLKDGQILSDQVATQAAPIVSISSIGEITAVSSVEMVWVNIGSEWQSLGTLPNEEAIADIQLTKEDHHTVVKALTGDGRLWRMPLS